MANSVEIGWRTQLSTETIAWQDDLTAAFDTGDAINSVTSTLIDLLTGASFPSALIGSPTFVGNVVQQVVGGLTAGHNYRLVWTANLGGAKAKASALLISTPY